MKKKRSLDDVISSIQDKKLQANKGYLLLLSVDEDDVYDYDKLEHQKYSRKDLKSMLIN